MRNSSGLDTIIGGIDTALRTLLTPQQRHCTRVSPGHSLPEPSLTSKEIQHVAGLMRVNHSGEVCAQALYQGQALTTKLDHIKDQMQRAADEEVDHLGWCEERLQDLKSQPSLLNPLWYSGSFILGAVAGLLGDRWSLGFVAETERQVSAHIQDHLQKIPVQDEKTKAILLQMHTDETQHAEEAQQAGAANLPYIIQKLMQNVSKLMTRSSYYL